MNDIIPDDRWSDTDRLLYLILMELRGNKTTTSSVNAAETTTIAVTTTDASTTKVVDDRPEYLKHCKYCNGEHLNKGEFMQCAKKNKKG